MSALGEAGTPGSDGGLAGTEPLVVAGLPVVIRPARLTDAVAAAQLLYEATGPRVADAIWGLGDRGRALIHYERLFARPGCLHSYDIATVAELDGWVVGLIVHAPWQALVGRWCATMWSYARIFGPLGILRLYPRLRHLMRASPTIPDDHYFVPYLAVARGFRGRGIGRRLLEGAHKAGVVANAPVCSLYVAIDGAKAQRFYCRLGYGYIERGSKTSAGLERLTGVTGRVHMARKLDR